MHAIAGRRNQSRTATLHVSVIVGAAFRRGLHALEEILAIALVALAIALPFALSALAVWWSAATLRQRARERAMRAV